MCDFKEFYSSKMDNSQSISQLILFKEKAIELFDCWESSNLKPLNQQALSRTDDGKVVGNSMAILKHSEKSVFLDFRKFVSDGEDTNFFKILNILKRYWRDEPEVMKALEQSKILWQDAAPMARFSKLTPDELIKLVFNTRYFHNGTIEQREKFEELISRIDESLLMDFLINTVLDRIRALKMIHTLLSEFSEESIKIIIPNNWFDRIQNDINAAKKNKFEQERLLEDKHEFEKKMAIQEKFNRSKSFDESIIKRVKVLYFGHGATPEEIAKSINLLSIDDAKGIINNINMESCERLGEEFEPL